MSHNVKMTFDEKKNELHIVVSADADTMVSKSGLTDILASTHGNIPVPGIADARIGMNVYVPRNLSPEEKTALKSAAAANRGARV